MSWPSSWWCSEALSYSFWRYFLFFLHSLEEILWDSFYTLGLHFLEFLSLGRTWPWMPLLIRRRWVVLHSHQAPQLPVSQQCLSSSHGLMSTPCCSFREILLNSSTDVRHWESNWQLDSQYRKKFYSHILRSPGIPGRILVRQWLNFLGQNDSIFLSVMCHSAASSQREKLFLGADWFPLEWPLSYLSFSSA